MKVFKRKIILLFLIFMQIALLSMPVFAISTGDSVLLYPAKKIEEVKMNYYGQDMLPFYTVYNEENIEYPVYCVNYEYAGITDERTYSVEITSNYLTSGTTQNAIGVWRAIINGYPFKTASELGCANNYEAYAATKQAVWCMLYSDREFKYFSYTGEEGKRVYEAMVEIVNIAKTSTQNELEANLSLTESEWVIDDENRVYTKNITIDSNIPMYSYDVEISNNDLEGLVVNKISSNEFGKSKKIEVEVPIENLVNDGEFTITVKAILPSTSFYYGKAPEARLQNYVVTTSQTAEISADISYSENKTKIELIKQDYENNNLSGVIFNLLDANKQIVYENIKTDEQGKFDIQHIIPGVYYIQEIETLPGYILNTDLIEIEICLNEEKNILVLNEKEPEKPKLPRTGF